MNALYILSALSCLSVTWSSGDSLNLAFETAENTDLTVLGEEGLSKHEGGYSLKVNENCDYILKLSFKGHSSDKMGSGAKDFEGGCAQNSGSTLLEHNRNWLQFRDYVKETTGFDHASLYPRPCGLEPLGRRQPRYDVNFYNVPAHVRALWNCEIFSLPEQCAYSQPDALGRGHFSLPRLNNNVDLVPNTPRSFQPYPSFPQALAYEGLMVARQDNIPQTYEDMDNPEFEMGSYDGDITSFRAILPHQYVSGSDTFRHYWGFPVYEYQTLPYLPHLWNVTYTPATGIIEVYIQGKARLCGEAFDAAKQEQESD
ncbi:unnamed protein product [Cylindrotheca closterium]|uniref:Beta-galactosidase n=1 Tax=Cylindrotheca closterium TaxID=2856 RepID=A0AAD2JQ15_9STRA|nr:unnamed protein product [Cylindrotheca closterium]